eukprot:SAG31_NODE_143_length_22627_cov_14.541347_8_plen_64_part_00
MKKFRFRAKYGAYHVAMSITAVVPLNQFEEACDAPDPFFFVLLESPSKHYPNAAAESFGFLLL